MLQSKVARSILSVFGILLLFSVTGCKSSNSEIGTISAQVPANVSTNAAWGGGMCEANGEIYYISGPESKSKIIRIKQDGSNSSPVTGTYDSVHELSADSTNLYFVTTSGLKDIDTLYRLPLNGGKEQKITDGHIQSLQNVNGKIYWEDLFIPTGTIKKDQTASLLLRTINPDGSGIQTLYHATVSAGSPGTFEFVAAEDGIYYAVSTPDTEQCNIYHMDLSGKNRKKLNSQPLSNIDQLFYDRGKLYFLMQHDGDGFITELFWDSVETIDQNGSTKNVIGKIGYFPQDYGCVEYCGVSDGKFYFFNLKPGSSPSKSLLMDLHQVDLDKNKDTIILQNVEMGDKAVGKISSVRGKHLSGDVNGLYILGNDIYFSPFDLP